MKILHIVQATGGGVEKYVYTFLKNVDRTKFENHLLYSKLVEFENFLPLLAGVKRLPMRRSIGLSDIKNIFLYRKEIKKIRPDVIYCHSSKAGAVGRLASLGLGIKTVYNAHGWAFNMQCPAIMRYLYLFIEWFLAFFSDRIVCISQYELDCAKRYHIGNEKKLRLIYNGVDISAMENDMAASPLTRERLGIPSDAFVVGMNGRISQQKAPDVFVQMAAMLKKHISKAYFLVVGDGTQRDEMIELFARNGLEDCYSITGWVKDTAPYMKLIDVAVLMSRWEGFGLALCDYMVAGVPIVATNVDAIPELVNDGKNGFLVNQDDAGAACSAVLKLYNDPGLRMQFAENGKKIVYEKFDMKRTVSQHEELFDSLK